jgi:hypothetical protein
MIPDDRLEPMKDEQGGIWQFYQGGIPGTDAEYTYTLQLPSEIHNYIVETYISTQDKGPLPDDFQFTTPMMEDIGQKWEAMAGERPLDMTAFRAAVEETVNHRYYRQQEEIPFDALVEQRESVINEPFDPEQQPQKLEEPDLPSGPNGTPIDIEQINQAIDQGQLGDVGPETNDFINPDLLEPAPLNFGESVGNLADYMSARVQGLRHTINDIPDTFGR